jgi:prevent-host-death family protein
MQKITSRQFNQDVGAAKRAASKSPVMITDRGKPAHVLLTYEAWRALGGPRRDLAASLSMPGLSEIDFDPPKATIGLREADLS